MYYETQFPILKFAAPKNLLLGMAFNPNFGSTNVGSLNLLISSPSLHNRVCTLQLYFSIEEVSTPFFLASKTKK